MKKTPTAGIGLLLLAAATLSYFLGYQASCKKFEDWEALRGYGSRTFYAAVAEIHDDYLTVKGRNENDINFRESFTGMFSMKGVSCYSCVAKEISPSELKVGDMASVTFTGCLIGNQFGPNMRMLQVWLLDDGR